MSFVAGPDTLVRVPSKLEHVEEMKHACFCEGLNPEYW